MPKRAQITILAIAFAWLVPHPATAAVPADIPTEVPEGLEWPDGLDGLPSPVEIHVGPTHGFEGLFSIRRPFTGNWRPQDCNLVSGLNCHPRPGLIRKR